MNYSKLTIHEEYYLQLIYCTVSFVHCTLLFVRCTPLFVHCTLVFVHCTLLTHSFNWVGILCGESKRRLKVMVYLVHVFVDASVMGGPVKPEVPGVLDTGAQEHAECNVVPVKRGGAQLWEAGEHAECHVVCENRGGVQLCKARKEKEVHKNMQKKHTIKGRGLVMGGVVEEREE